MLDSTEIMDKSTILENLMENQSYFTESQWTDNRCDLTRPILVNCAGYVKNDTPFVGSRIRKDWYLLLMAERSLTLADDISFLPGQFIIHSPLSPVHYENTSHLLGYYWVHFTGSWVASLLEKIRIEPDRVYTVPSDVMGTLPQEFTRLFREFILRRNGFDEMTASYLSALLVRLGRSIHPSPSESDTTVRRRLEHSIRYIHSHYTEALRIGDLAAIEHLSDGRYRELFRVAFGVSPSEYITNLRLSEACELLVTTDLTVTEVAEQSRYNDVLYFCRLFKKRHGIPPGHFRKKETNLL